MEFDSCEVFLGVKFVLFGFNYVDEKQVRSKLIDGGGVDVGQYGPSCTHVIVDKNKIVYDDPVCVAARNDGKLLVTGLWVDHRHDSGLLADASSVLYRPLRELNGIPGAKSLIMCLTGYQRQDRDDVMTMVGLIGAQFSKPLVANKVTHLICYKFEGDKYELAKKLRTIKLVNHRWLEDSLKDWMLLPESNYNMSGYDMEMFEAEAKDSEEESNSDITKHSAKRNTKSPDNMKFGLHSTSGIPNTLPASRTLDDRTNIADTKIMLTVPTTDTKFSPSGKFDKHGAVGRPTCQEDDVFSAPWTFMPSDMHIQTSESEKPKVKNEVVTTPSIAARSPRLCATSYSRKSSSKSPLPLFSGERLDRDGISCKMAVVEMKDNISVDVSSAKMDKLKCATFAGHEQNSSWGTDLFGTGDSNATLPLKRISDVSCNVSPSHKMSENSKSCTLNSPSVDEKILGLEMRSVSLNNNDYSESRAKNLQHSRAITDTPSSIKKPLTCDLPISNGVSSPTEDVSEDSKKTSRTPFQISGKVMSPDKPDKLNHVSSSCGNDEKLFSSSPQDVSIGVKQVVETTDMGIFLTTMKPWMRMTKLQIQKIKKQIFEQPTMDKENFVEVQLMSDEDKLAKETASGVKCNNSTSLLDDTIPSGTAEVIEPREPVSIGDVQLDELRVEDEKSKLNVGERSPTEETTLINKSKMKSKQGKVGKAPRKKTEKTGKKPQLLAAGPHTEVHTIPDYKSEKENEPCNVGDKTTDLVDHCLAKPAVKSNANQRKANKKCSEISVNSSMEVEEVLREVNLNLDSHQWSYQATHFIAPDPVRRTEKFFSAAASGRWILKSDYLTDSSQAGKLLKEEPYEWYQNSLTEDGAINLEAPRKWRLLREKTGHGAFYGMRIIIYGECIAPPLDTLKRAVKAGDGTILATSPPYTRFLNSGVDFAVVSPGMPRADMWVQEFLNNEISCVAADYLVEYVCKPGYPLDKHVLYNTHAWAEKSFGNLQSRAEVSKDESPQDDL
ncbi:BRCT domain-containing protein, partial [Cucurbita argyrosperma subsp. sororia]